MVWHPHSAPFSSYKKQVFKKAIKTCDFIHQIGEYEELRNSSKSVSLDQISSRETKQKITYLKKCLIKFRKLTGYGRGITAVQVGIPERFSVIYKGQTIINIKNNKNIGFEDLEVIINPKITGYSKNLFKYPEMCMSATPVIVPTTRPSWIEFEYYDEKGEKRIWKVKDDTEVGKMMNRVYQHEFDHMEGIINIDKIKNPEEIILESNPDYYKNAKFETVK